MATESKHNLNKSELALLRSLAIGHDWDQHLSRSTAHTMLYRLRQLGFLAEFDVTDAGRAALRGVRRPQPGKD